MPIILFSPSQQAIEVPKGTRVFDAAQDNGLSMASSCDGNKVCGKCVIQVLKGAANLSSPDTEEQGIVQREGNPSSDRLSCCVRVLGDCTVTTRYW